MTPKEARTMTKEHAAKALTLTDISEAQARLLDLDMTEEELKPFLDSLRLQSKDKILAIGHVIQELESQNKAIEERIHALTERLGSRNSRVSRLKQYLLSNMLSLGIPKVDSPDLTIWTQENPPSVEAVDLAAVPKEWFRATLSMLWSEVPEEMQGAVKSTAIEKGAILELHRAGQPLPPGVEIRSEGHHLRMKP